jgi:hypothetical protein
LAPILLKNSIAAATFSVVEKVDPLERSQSDANEPGDGLKPPILLHENGETSFSTGLDSVVLWPLIAASLPAIEAAEIRLIAHRQSCGGAIVPTAQSYIRFRATPIVGP